MTIAARHFVEMLRNVPSDPGPPRPSEAQIARERWDALEKFMESRFFPVTKTQIVEGMPDWYPPEAAVSDSSPCRTLLRDLARLERRKKLARRITYHDAYYVRADRAATLDNIGDPELF